MLDSLTSGLGFFEVVVPEGPESAELDGFDEDAFPAEVPEAVVFLVPVGAEPLPDALVLPLVEALLEVDFAGAGGAAAAPLAAAAKVEALGGMAEHYPCCRLSSERIVMICN